MNTTIPVSELLACLARQGRIALVTSPSMLHVVYVREIRAALAKTDLASRDARATARRTRIEALLVEIETASLISPADDPWRNLRLAEEVFEWLRLDEEWLGREGLWGVDDRRRPRAPKVRKQRK